MKRSSIKPCPHCGAEANLVTTEYPATQHEREFSEYQVECTNSKCWATVGPQDTPREAIEVWNRRMQ